MPRRKRTDDEKAASKAARRAATLRNRERRAEAELLAAEAAAAERFNPRSTPRSVENGKNGLSKKALTAEEYRAGEKRRLVGPASEVKERRTPRYPGLIANTTDEPVSGAYVWTDEERRDRDKAAKYWSRLYDLDYADDSDREGELWDYEGISGAWPARFYDSRERYDSRDQYDELAYWYGDLNVDDRADWQRELGD